MSKFARYARQIQASPLGDEGQARLSNASVAVVGVGGLGGLVCQQLVGAGVGQLKLIDNDLVSLTNLHRQWLFNEHNINQFKALVAADNLKKLNSQVKIKAQTERLNPSTVDKFIENADLIIDAADNFITSYLLSDACQRFKKPLLLASVNQRFGYLGIFCGATAPGLRAVFPEIPRNQTSCETVGVTGPAVGVVASLQAQAALDYLHRSVEHSLLGKLLYVDLNNYSMHRVDFRTATEPRGTPIELITANEIQTQDTVIDVRSSQEIEEQPQKFRVDQNINVEQINEARLKDQQGGGRLVLACKSGQRALFAAQELKHTGLENLAVIVP